MPMTTKIGLPTGRKVDSDFEFGEVRVVDDFSYEVFFSNPTSGGPVRVSILRGLKISIQTPTTYSQPVLKKLVCDNSTPFHE